MSKIVTRLDKPFALPRALLNRLDDVDEMLRRASIERMLPQDALSWLAHHARRFRKESVRLAVHVDRLGFTNSRAECHRLLRSFSARVSVAAKTIIVDGRYEGEDRYRLNRLRLTSLAAGINVYQPLSGCARMVSKLKPPRDIRPTLGFSGNVRSAQFLVEVVLAAQGIASSTDFSTKGLGSKVALRHIEEAMLEGYSDWLSFDLAHNFPSVKRKHLAWLPLPDEVITHVVFVNGEIHISNDHECNEEIKQAVRQGLPQGASLSGMIAGALLERKLQAILEGDYRQVSYVDDVAIGARSRSQIDYLAKAIKRSFENDPAGPLAFSKFEVSTARTGVEFLGSHLSVKASGAPTVRRRPSNAAWRRFVKKLRGAFAECDGFDERIRRGEKYATNWAQAFGDWWIEPVAFDHLMNVVHTEAGHFSTVLK